MEKIKISGGGGGGSWRGRRIEGKVVTRRVDIMREKEEGYY